MTREMLIPEPDPEKWKTIEGAGGVRVNTLWEAPSGASIAILDFPSGGGMPSRHAHASNQFMYCLEGQYEYTSSGLVLTPGSFYWNPRGNEHGPTHAHAPTRLLEIYDGAHYFVEPEFLRD